MRIMLEPGAYKPTRAHDTDAGLDIRAMHGAVIAPHESAVIHTGVHIQLPPGTCGILISKSGLNVNGDMTSTGLIDEGYKGEIIVKLYNHGKKYQDIRPGDKVSQLVVTGCLYEPVEIVDSITGGDRGDDGFGSTGK